MRIGLVGILAGAALTVSAYDGLLARTAPATDGVSVRHQITQMLGIEMDVPCFAENRTVGIILKVFSDITGVDASGDDED